MCNACGSKQRSQFRSEICLHFNGLPDLNRPPILMFPELTVCLKCGMVEQFAIEEGELNRLRDVWHVA